MREGWVQVKSYKRANGLLFDHRPSLVMSYCFIKMDRLADASIGVIAFV